MVPEDDMEPTALPTKPIRAIEVVVGLVTLLAVSGCQKVPSEPGEDTTAKPATTFSHDQQPATKVEQWGNSWLVTSSRALGRDKHHRRFLELDLANQAAKEVLPPDGGEIFAVTTGANGQQLALVRQSSMILLMTRREGEWHPIEIPKELAMSHAKFFLVTSDDNNLLILAEQVLWHRLDGEWRRVSLPTSGGPEKLPNSSDHLALAGNKLYIGFNRGEWGGAVAALDLVKHTWVPTSTSTRFDDGLPVHGFKRDRSGDLWVVEGLAHLRQWNGSLRVLRKDQWVQFARTSGKFSAEKDKWLDERTVNWSFPATDFIDLDFDKDGRPYVLTPYLGILRHEDGSWQRMTNQWPDFSYRDADLGGIVTNTPRGLVVVDDHTAIIAANATGVLVWDIKSDKATRIPIKNRSP